MISRRHVIQYLSSLPLIGGLLGSRELITTPKASAERDYFNELGLRTFINAAGTYTALTASLMPEEVLEAINYASKRYVRLDDLQECSGGEARNAARSHRRRPGVLPR